MFWWRKRNEGFEWRDYVRTTILVRREQRRQRLKDAQAAAAENVKRAGRRSLDAGVAGARLAGTGTWSALTAAAHAAASGLGHAGHAAAAALIAAAGAAAAALSGLAAVLARLGAPLGPRLAPLLAGVRAPRANLMLKAVAALAALGAVYRTWAFGFDGDAIAAAGIAAVAAILVLAATLADPDRPRRRSQSREGLLARLGAHASELTQRTPLSADHMRRAGAAALALAILGGGAYYAYYYAPPLSIAGSSSAPATTGALPDHDPSRLEGRALAVTGDRLRVAGTLVVLDSIEAPEPAQSCRRGSGTWRCGAAAREALAGLVRGRQIVCDILAEDEGEKRARCYARGADIAEALVRKGHVFAAGGFLARYAGLESEAAAEKLGLWSGDAERPQDYRDKRWQEASRGAPEGCPIKGRVRAGARVYVLPWAPGYDGIKLSPARGERWFCSAREAEAAGWSPAAPS